MVKTIKKANIIHSFIKNKHIFLLITLIMVFFGSFVLLWRMNHDLAKKGMVISIVCLLIGGVTYYNKKKKTDTYADEMDWDDLLYDENDEQWMCHKDDVQQRKEMILEKNFETEKNNREEENIQSDDVIDSADVVYGETVFFKSEQLKEVKKLKPLTDDFPEFTIELFPFVLGKLKGAVDGVIEHETVSRIHCKIEYEEGSYFITDLNSTNGTIINEDMLNANEKRGLNSGDELRIGRAIYVFQ